MYSPCARPRSRCLRAGRVLLAALAFALSAPACSPGSPDGAAAKACSDAAGHVKELRAQQVAADPTLKRYPEVAREHLRQTEHVFTDPLARRCAADPDVATCVMAATSMQQASACMGG